MSPMGSSCVIIGVLGIISLGGGNVTGTLVGAMVGTYLGTTIVWVVSGCILLNSISNLSMTCNWLSPIRERGLWSNIFDFMHQFFGSLRGLLCS